MSTGNSQKIPKASWAQKCVKYCGNVLSICSRSPGFWSGVRVWNAAHLPAWFLQRITWTTPSSHATPGAHHPAQVQSSGSTALHAPPLTFSSSTIGRTKKRCLALQVHQRLMWLFHQFDATEEIGEWQSPANAFACGPPGPKHTSRHRATRNSSKNWRMSPRTAGSLSLRSVDTSHEEWLFEVIDKGETTWNCWPRELN